MAKVNGEYGFTQFTKVNILEKLTVGGVVTNPTPSLPPVGDITLTETAADIKVDASLGDVNVYLPALSAGNRYNIKKGNTSGGNVVIHANGSDTIDGSSTHTLVGSLRPSSYIVGFSDEWSIL